MHLAMRQPNPPKVMIENLTAEQRQKVVKVALAVVTLIESGREWGAYAIIEMVDESFTLEEKLALASCWNSQQAATITSMRAVSRAK